jgi:hypothetical protein
MKKHFVLAAALAGAGFLSQAAQADGAVRVRYGIANTDYGVTYEDAFGTEQAASSYTATNVGLTVISSGGVYFDAVVGSSEDGAKYKGDPDWFGGQTGNFVRSDTTLTVGFSQPSADGSSAAFFFGYKSGETELKVNSTNVRDLFETSGFFFGMSYGFPVGGGHFGVNGALSFMSGSWDWNGASPFKADADFTVGFSLGANYTYMFGSNVGMSVEAKYNSYTYDFGVDGNTVLFTIDETITSVGVNLFAQF